MTKKIIVLVLGGIILFAGCAVKQGDEGIGNPQTQETDVKKDSNESGQVILEKNGITLSVFSETSGDTKKDFLKVSGLSDSTVEEKLNEELHTFSTWGDATDYVVSGSIIGNAGNGFISVKRDGTYYPEKEETFFNTQILDLTTGEQAGGLTDFVTLGKDFRKLITNGTFVQMEPDPDGEVKIKDAAERLAVEIVDKNKAGDFDIRFYLTDDVFGLYTELADEGKILRFEAPYNAVRSVLSEKLLSAIDS